MKLFELLTGQTMPPTSSPSGPMGMPPMAQATPSSTPGTKPMQTAGILDTAKNFFSTPQPIGGGAPASPIGPNTGAGNAIANAVPGVSTINNALSGGGAGAGQPQPMAPETK